MHTAFRRLVPLAFAGLLLAATAPGAAAVTANFPNQSLGNRGADVRAVQGLLRAHGIPSVIDGVFGTVTVEEVKTFQTANGLNPNGVVGTTTWEKLIVGLTPGSTGEAVKVVQRQLNAKRHAGLAVDGIYGTATRNAVIAFQRHIGMTQHGNVGPVTWRRILWHYDYPSFKTALCDYSVGNGKANWGTGAAIGQIEAAAALFLKTGHGRVPIGDVSREHGGDIALHQSHERGLDVDVRPIRDNENQCTWGTNWRLASYDRGATRALDQGDPGRRTGPRQAHLLQRPGAHPRGPDALVLGHDDHLHVRYCEKSYPIAAYRC